MSKKVNKAVVDDWENEDLPAPTNEQKDAKKEMTREELVSLISRKTIQRNELDLEIKKLQQKLKELDRGIKRVNSRSGFDEIMKSLDNPVDAVDNLMENNRVWVRSMLYMDPTYFSKLSLGQTPKYLIIACADSRVSPDTILGLQPGECFVHRNVANLVVTGDVNFLSVLNYGVHYLLVKHIIVIGHQYCGGCKAATSEDDYGLLEHWLRNIRDVIFKNMDEITAISDETLRARRIVELNVKEQCLNLYRNPLVQKKQVETGGKYPTVNGFVYDMKVGLLTKLDANFREELSKNHMVYGVQCKK